MQIVRMLGWLLILFALLVFSWANWSPGVTVRIWEGMVVDTRLPAVVILSFLLGLIPMWLYHRGDKWRLKRRIKALEDAARLTASSPAAAPERPDDERPVTASTRTEPSTTRDSDALSPRPTP